MEMVTVISIAVTTTKFLFGMCDCTVNNNVGTGDFSLVLGEFARVDTRTCDRTCLRTWAGKRDNFRRDKFSDRAK